MLSSTINKGHLPRESGGRRRQTRVFRLLLAVLAMLGALVLVEIGLRTTAVVMRWQWERHNRSAALQFGTYRILCVGESTTALGGEDSYPCQIERVLNSRNVGIRFSVFNAGSVGACTTKLVADVDSHIAKHQPAMVITMMGINDEGNPLVRKPASGLSGGIESLRTVKLARMGWDRLTRSGPHDKDAISAEIAKMLPPTSKDELSKASTHAWAERLAGNYSGAHLLFEEIVGRNPSDDRAYAALGGCLKALGRDTEALDSLAKALTLNPSNELALCELGDFHLYRGATNKALSFFASALVANESNTWALTELSFIEMHTGNTNAAKNYLRHAASTGNNNDWALGRLAVCLGNQGRRADAERYLDAANAVRSSMFNPITERNYLALADNLKKRGIRLICMQYPCRSVLSLKRALEAHDDVLFVSNEEPFRQAVISGEASKYFTDLFGGEFGHCTPAANAAIAENAARVILPAVLPDQSSP